MRIRWRISDCLVALLCIAVAILVGCGGKSTPDPTPPVTTFNFSLTGRTVTKMRTTETEVVLLEERLTSIFEDGPERTLAILASDAHTVQIYAPPSGWFLVDFAVHPSGDISVILTTATEVRIV